MYFSVIGSGGCTSTPRPLCQCNVCVEARQKGYPYKRCGCSLYLEDCSLLVDTPEDIAAALNNADIKRIDHVLYSHWDPDHTLGMRIMEQLRLDWLDHDDGRRTGNPINVYAQEQVMSDIKQIGNKYGSFLGYYQHMGLIRCITADDSIVINDVTITFVPVKGEEAVSVFIFESKGKKLVYAPCDCIPFPSDDRLKDADVLVIGNTIVGPVLKNGKVIPADHPLLKELYSVNDVIDITHRLNIKKVVITHIEEDWGKSYSDYLSLERQYSNLKFAYDGMAIEL